MEVQQFINNSIFIQATAQKVWSLLTSAEETKKYMYGCETVSDWKVGSSLDWQMMHDGNLIVVVTGQIKEIEENTLLVYTVFDPNSELEDIPENHLTVSYRLTSENGGTRLDVQQGDYTKVGEGEKRYKETYNDGQGWDPILVQIKAIAEAS